LEIRGGGGGALIVGKNYERNFIYIYIYTHTHEHTQRERHYWVNGQKQQLDRKLNSSSCNVHQLAHKNLLLVPTNLMERHRTAEKVSRASKSF
jgi:hypothetical protein